MFRNGKAKIVRQERARSHKTQTASSAHPVPAPPPTIVQEGMTFRTGWELFKDRHWAAIVEEVRCHRKSSSQASTANLRLFQTVLAECWHSSDMDREHWKELAEHLRLPKEESWDDAEMYRYCLISIFLGASWV